MTQKNRSLRKTTSKFGLRNHRGKTDIAGPPGGVGRWGGGKGKGGSGPASGQKRGVER